MSEMEFFKRYNDLIEVNEKKNSYFCECVKETKEIQSKLKELPFSNPWIAQQTVNKLPKNSVIHFGILNSLRSWNYFDIDCNVRKYANTGGFGIDGCCSSLVGAAISNKDTLFFGVVGDLAFFYDLNVMGNRHIGNNLRIMIINNGRGTEFRNEIHLASRFEDNVDKYIAAAGHFGNKSRCLVKNFVEDLGYKYLSAKNKEEYMKYVDLFTDPNKREYSIVFEIFTDYRDESDAISMLCMTEDNVKNKK